MYLPAVGHKLKVFYWFINHNCCR